MFREEATPAFAGFHADPLSWSNWDSQFWFLWREKTGENPQNTLNPVLIGERQASSPVYHSYSP